MNPTTKKDLKKIYMRSFVLCLNPRTDEDDAKLFFKARYLSCKEILKYNGTNAKINELPLLLNSVYSIDQLIDALSQFEKTIQSKAKSIFHHSELRALIKNLILELATKDFSQYTPDGPEMNSLKKYNRYDGNDGNDGFGLVLIHGIDLLIGDEEPMIVNGKSQGFPNARIFQLAEEQERAQKPLIKSARSRLSS